MSVGLGFLGSPGLREMARAAAIAERNGFESAWMSETRITRDAVSAMTALLLATDTMRVGSSAINVFTRAPALVATTWATMAEAAPGRVVLGIGVGSGSTLAQQGIRVDHAVGRMREFTEAVRGAWTSSGSFSYAGRYVQFEDLEVELQPQQALPIYFCAGGPQMLALAGRVANGVIADVFLPPESVRTVVNRTRSGSEPFSGELAAAIVTSVADTRAEAAARLRPRLASYLIAFPELAREMRFDPEFLGRLRDRALADGLETIYGELSDDLIASCAVCGPPAACREALARYRAAGIELSILFPEPQSLEATVRELGPSPDAQGGM
jgi:5,10-methylenetetrahydromethanopterin reductase